MQKTFRVLVINPEISSTRFGLYRNEVCLFEQTIHHQVSALSNKQLIEQRNLRKQAILEHMDYEGINVSKLDAVCARGGLLHPIEGGTYQVNNKMLDDLSSCVYGTHVSNLGGIIAHDIASNLNIPAYIVDPVVIDEMNEFARYSGLPEIPRRSIFHALNQKAAARKSAVELNQSYDELNLIVAHMGNGITIGLHSKGRVVDVNNGLNGDGPFSPNRTGDIPVGDLVSLCYSGNLSFGNMMKKLVSQGGLMAYLNTDDISEIEERIKRGDQYAEEVYEAMAYQIAKEIGALGTVCSGQVDAIILTGKYAYGELLVNLISKRVDWIADTIVYPGENILQSIAEGTLRVLHNLEASKTYGDKE